MTIEDFPVWPLQSGGWPIARKQKLLRWRPVVADWVVVTGFRLRMVGNFVQHMGPHAQRFNICWISQSSQIQNAYFHQDGRDRRHTQLNIHTSTITKNIGTIASWLYVHNTTSYSISTLLQLQVAIELRSPIQCYTSVCPIQTNPQSTWSKYCWTVADIVQEPTSISPPIGHGRLSGVPVQSRIQLANLASCVTFPSTRLCQWITIASCTRRNKFLGKKTTWHSTTGKFLK